MNEMDDLNRPSNGPLVTVVTPSFNQGRFIRETIESVLSQDYPNLEYMVIDGGSMDETVSVLESYCDRFFWISEPDQGQAHAINKGWKCGKGEILAWLNSDDVYLPGAISKGVRYLLDHPEVGMVYGEAYHMTEEGQNIDRYPTEAFDVERLKETCFICQPATFVRRAVIDDVGTLDESLQFSMDYDLWIRLSKKQAVGHLSDYLAKSRLYAGAKTLRDRPAVYKETVTMLHRHFGSVAPTWLFGYAYWLLDNRLNRSKFWHRWGFRFCLPALYVWNFLLYNLGMPLTWLGRR